MDVIRGTPASPANEVEPAQAGISLAFAFVALVTTLVIATAAAILMIVQYSASKSIGELLREKAEIISYSIVDTVRSQLEPVAAQSAFTADILRGIDIANAPAGSIGAQLYTSLAGTPQISSIALVDEKIRLIRAFRNRPAGSIVTSDWSDDAAFSGMIRAALARNEPHWGPLFRAESSGATLLNFITPLEAKDRKRFVLVASVSLEDLSKFLRTLQNEMTGQAFILYGRNAVLASTTLDANGVAVDDKNPLPLLAQLPGTTLSNIWSDDRLEDVETKLANGIQARAVNIGSERIVFLFRELAGFGERSWYVGTYFPLDALSPQLSRSKTTILTSLVIIVLAALVALFFSRVVSRPIRQIAAAARDISHWQSAGRIALPRSVFREIREVNNAFRFTTKAFESLQAYVPKTLALRLVERGDLASIESEEHDITVLFTDLVDFTGLAESQSPKEVVRFLNNHFTLLAECIEAERGIVDKFIGNSAMAFWGGLETDLDHAVHACRAALRIADAMHRENGIRRANGQRPLQVRIGIHSGRAMVGNIGSSGRINYTVIGDSVNTSERLERLAREISDADAEVATLISGETAMQLGPEFLISPIGRKVLHGRHQGTDVFILKSGRGLDEENPERLNEENPEHDATDGGQS